MFNLSTTFAGILLKNPILLASGTCGFGRELYQRFPLEKLGGLCTKGLTLQPRSGNEGYRIWETPSGILNSVGLENPGIQGFIENELPFLQKLNMATVINLSGHSLEDYEKGAILLDAQKFHMLELNISCPNVKEGGMNFGLTREAARPVVKLVRQVCKNHPLMVKLSPNAENIVTLAQMCEEEGADAISMVNTYLAMAIDLKTRKSIFHHGYAGLSGPAIKPIALRMVHQVAKAVSIPVMGLGGITTWQDAAEFILAGASAVQIGTATFMEPDRSLQILEGLQRWGDREGIASLEEIRGSL